MSEILSSNYNKSNQKSQQQEVEKEEQQHDDLLLLDYVSASDLAPLSKSEAVNQRVMNSNKMQEKYFQAQLTDGDENPDQKFQIITDGPLMEDSPAD